MMPASVTCILSKYCIGCSDAERKVSEAIIRDVMEMGSAETEVPAVVRALRRGTRESHRQLDHHPRLQPLVRAGLTRRSYLASLIALYRPHALLEAAVANAAARLGLDDETALSPPRLPCLQDDISMLGGELPSLCEADSGDTDTPMALVGQRYVLEGSRLGGQLIARRIGEMLGPDVPRRFFGAPAPDVHWRDFLVFAEYHCPPGETAAAVVAAQTAFTDFLARLDDTRD